MIAHTSKRDIEGFLRINTGLFLFVVLVSSCNADRPKTTSVIELISVPKADKGGETVKVHIKHIMEKLGASDRTQAVAIGVRRGIIQL